MTNPVCTKLRAGALDLHGHKYGRLTVMEFVGSINRKTYWRCRCECGAEKTIQTSWLRTGNTKSCGCLKRDPKANGNRRHGWCHTPTYSSWCAMIARVSRPTHKRYHQYGGRGITVCKRWRKFENFLADMGEKPSQKHSIEREDNDGNYEPGNCRWATAYEQAANKGPRKKRSTLPTGVRRDRKRFAATIRRDGRQRHLGMFDTAEAAGKAYEQAAAEWATQR